jgi:hypothetical protein
VILTALSGSFSSAAFGDEAVLADVEVSVELELELELPELVPPPL